MFLIIKLPEQQSGVLWRYSSEEVTPNFVYRNTPCPPHTIHFNLLILLDINIFIVKKKPKLKQLKSFSYLRVDERAVHDRLFWFLSIEEKAMCVYILTGYFSIQVLNLIQIYNSILIRLDIFQRLI